MKRNDYFLEFTTENLKNSIYKKNSFNIKEFESSFGKEFCVVSPDNCTGIIKHYDLDESFEVSILKSKGESEYALFYPNRTESVVAILYCTGGSLFLSSEIEKDFFHLKKGDILIYEKSNEKILNYSVKSKNFENILIFLYIDNIEKYLLKLVNPKSFFDWKSKIFGIFKNNVFCYGISNYKLETLGNFITNKPVDTLEDFLFFKQKVLDFFLLILHLKMNSKEKIISDNIIIVNQIKELLDNYEISKIPSLTELSKITNLTKYQLNQAFIELENNTLTQYITKLKMEHAKLLLINTNENITTIAFEIGYESPSKFSNNFKNHFGILPNKFRHNFKK